MSPTGEDTFFRVRRRYLTLGIAVFGGCFLLISINNASLLLQLGQPRRSSWRTPDPTLAVDTPGCYLPALHPLSDEVRQYVNYPTNMAPCPHHKHPVLNNNDTHIWIVRSNLNNHNITDENKLSCCYRPFYRRKDIQDVTGHSNDNQAHFGECTRFSSYVNVGDEFVVVSCSFNDKEVYTQYFLFAPNKPISLYDEAIEAPRNESSYNVIILGIDNVSRLNLHRTMPKTVAYLKQLGAVELLGYNKVADNSFPNLVPMLMGHSEEEIREMCHPFTHRPFDECPFVWYGYKRKGYYTAMAEDCSNLGTFNYLLDGFNRVPTDYYAHTFMHQAQEHVGTNKDFNSFLCMNDKFFFQVLIDYFEKITETLSSSRLFGFFWEVTMSHDYLNYPMVMDDSYEGLFKRLAARKYLEETIIFLVSDHGIRWGPIRSTKQGKLEERLPFVFVLTPPALREQHPEAYHNLQLNSGRLTTPFDLHETLMDLIDLNNVEDERIKARMKESYATKRGMSLFLPIPGNRTCTAAGIPEHWCACIRGRSIAQNSLVAKRAADGLVQELNALLHGHAQCAHLTVQEVVRASELEAGGSGAGDIAVVVRAAPGDGLFEGTLRVEASKWSLAGGASRLNLYGNQSHCVNDPHLKLFCYCI